MAILVPDIGPRFGLIGNPTTALGAGLTDLGLVRAVSTSLDPRIKYGATVTGSKNLEARFFQGLDGQIELMIARSATEGIDRALDFVDENHDFVNLGASLPKQSLIIVHPDDATGGAAGASAKTLWYPGVSISAIGQTTYNAAGEESDEGNFVTVTFELGYLKTDQAGNAIPEGAQPYFRGDRLAAHGMGYALPTPYGPAA